MDNFFSRFRTETIVAGILLAQVILLATQVQVTDPSDANSNRKITLIRSWAVSLVSPVQRGAIHTGGTLRSFFSDYVDFRNVRKDNVRLLDQVNQLRLEQARMKQDAEQGRRLQALLEFKEKFIARTLAAQVIGTSGTDLSRVIYVDRGTSDGVAAGMAVVTPDGIAGKVLRSDSHNSQVLLISDVTSGAGVMLERLRIKGVLKGSSSGRPEVLNIMADEKIEPGDRVITTGGDGVFPKGMEVGTVESVAPDKERDSFLAIKIKPAVKLEQLEEVLIITEMAVREPEQFGAGSGSGTTRAADLLSLRLPSAKKKNEEANASATAAPNKPGMVAAQTSPAGTAAKPGGGAPGPAAGEAIKKKSTLVEAKKQNSDGREVPR